ncbi:thioredoxin [Halovenus salina]|uniref:thioredoxin n=1 Tax=Halovenus salina TaxID=1510225 RepID=UPI002260BB18|nr:thioredoxin [Halovenus salina]
MSDATDDKLERIREQKRQELREQHSNDTDNQATDDADSPVAVRGRDHLDELISSTSPVLVDCYADWCGPCQMMEPTIEALAAETPALVAKVDIDAHQTLAGQLGVQSVPTLILYVDGEPVEQLVGAQDRATLEKLIRQYS